MSLVLLKKTNPRRMPGLGARRRNECLLSCGIVYGCTVTDRSYRACQPYMNKDGNVVVLSKHTSNKLPRGNSHS